MLSREKRMKILAKVGQPSVIPQKCDYYEKVPAESRQFVTR
ncbi:MAG: hypothetical protein WCO44_13795 [Bacteroidota bacterium]